MTAAGSGRALGSPGAIISGVGGILNAAASGTAAGLSFAQQQQQMRAQAAAEQRQIALMREQLAVQAQQQQLAARTGMTSAQAQARVQRAAVVIGGTVRLVAVGVGGYYLLRGRR